VSRNLSDHCEVQSAAKYLLRESEDCQHTSDPSEHLRELSFHWILYRDNNGFPIFGYNIIV
jgi:hypothetical protein